MKRKLFATAVVLVVMATPLFGAQASTAQSGKPAPAKTPAAPKAEEKKAVVPAVQKPAAPTSATPAPKPAAAAAAKPAPSAPKPAGTAAAKAAPSAPKPAGTAAAKAAPAPPKAPTIRASTNPKAVPAAPKANPLGAPRAVPAVAPKSATPASAAVVRAAPGTLSPVQESLHGNKDLAREVQAKMPGADVVGAAAGFKDLRQFVAAAHASHNLGLSFEALKGKLLTGKRTSLRQAIQELRPAASAAIEAQRAEYDANGMIRATQQSAAPAAPSAAPPSGKPAGTPPAKAVSKPKPSSTEQK